MHFKNKLVGNIIILHHVVGTLTDLQKKKKKNEYRSSVGNIPVCIRKFVCLNVSLESELTWVFPEFLSSFKNLILFTSEQNCCLAVPF